METSTNPNADEWISAFTQWLYEQGAGEKSVLSYLYDLGVFARWYQSLYGEAFAPSAANTVDFRAFRKFSLEVKRVKPATWNRRMISLRHLAAWALECEFVTQNAARDLKLAEEVELAPRSLTEKAYLKFRKELERGLNQARDTFAYREAIRNRAICLLMGEAGLREGEVVRLIQSDLVIGERSGRARIRMSKREVSGEVPLNKDVREALTAWLELNPELGADDFVFSGKGTPQLSGRQIQRIVGEIGLRIREKVTPHMLRHTCATRLYKNGKFLEAQKIMRHKSQSTTARYSMPSLDECQLAVDGIGL